MTQERAAKEARLAPRTVAYWAARPEFEALVEQYRAHIVDQLAVALDKGMREMVDLWLMMVQGGVSPSDGRLKWIRPIVEPFFLQSFTFAEKADSKEAGQAMAVQVNVGRNGT